MRLDWPESSPQWIRELDRLADSKGLIIFHGNTKDMLFYPVAGAGTGQGGWTWKRNPLREALFELFEIAGHQIVGSYNVVDGMHFSDPAMATVFAQTVAAMQKAVPKHTADVPQAPKIVDPIESALEQLRLCVGSNQNSSVLVIEHASQLISAPTNLERDQRLGFLRLLRASLEAAIVQGSGLKNIIIVVCDKLTDLPPWLLLSNSSAASIEITRPSGRERVRFFSDVPLKQGRQRDLEELADLTEGMTFRELIGLYQLSKGPDAPTDAKKLVDRFKFGVKESQWDNVVDRLVDAEKKLCCQVKGQLAAVGAVSDVLRRASLHLSGAHHASRSRPRGVLFFAGPTGVGKTELAKAIAKLVFGSEAEPIRFDMSEYSQAHSGDRLLGAPPGYVGYEEGGQLTNQIRSNPFCVLLFDEIEKADPSILDKFLQILEDGRMTDGRGETVYFGESIIIFTSNAGIYEIDPRTGRAAIDPKKKKPILKVDPNVTTDYPEIRSKIIEGVQDYFKHFLGRPELLNRIGQNIVVFDFVREDVMRQILVDKVLPAIEKHVAERLGLNLHFSEKVIEQLLDAASGDVAGGGRGIGNLAEAAVLNPLSGVLFDLVSQGKELRGLELEVGRIVLPDAASDYRYKIEWRICDA